MPTTPNLPTERFRPRDCDRRAYPIGIIRVPAGSGTDRGFQYACDWQEHEWDAQECVLWCDDHMVRWTLQTTITAEFFGTRRPPIEPKPGRWTRSGYDYDILAAIAKGEMDVTLLPDYAAGYETRTVGEGTNHAFESDFGHLLWNGTHALQVEQVWARNRDGKSGKYGLGYWDEQHAYDVFVRGEKVGELYVDRKRGFNGNTRGPAMSDALAAHKELVFA